ncbi:hypothetical protein EU537_05550 [Candidatus Thorarchaeota archaeon]|nr:MAG: hypothetical protein EU537_05550 [Candidatus Thorarchaeota archaeon]
MPEIEDMIVRDVSIYTLLGIFLRFILYGIPLVRLVWLYATLSLCIGVGGALLRWGRKTGNRKHLLFGTILAIIGLLPIQYLL